MNFSSTLSVDSYLNNKQYFDTHLIRLLHKQQSQIRNLHKKMGINEDAVYKKNTLITTLKLKYKDLNVVHYNLKQLLKATNDDAKKIIKDMDKEIRNINKIIDGELQRTYLENNELYDENEKLKKEIEELRRERDKYKRMAKQDSTNSSLPPSRDIAPRPDSLRETTTNKRGGQSGHTLHTSKLTKTPTKAITRTVAKAPLGATPVFNDAKEIEYYVTQEIDAKFVTTVTETRYYIENEAEELPTEIMDVYKINSVTYATSFKSTMKRTQIC